jgi:hypothetical protein
VPSKKVGRRTDSPRGEGVLIVLSPLAVGNQGPQGNTVTLIGEEAFVGSDARPWIYLPLMLKRLA